MDENKEERGHVHQRSQGEQVVGGHVCTVCVLTVLALPTLAVAIPADGHGNLGEVLPFGSLIPFAGILFSIAVIPTVNPTLRPSPSERYLAEP